MTTHDIRWFADQIGKSRDWTYRHLDEIPHRRIGRSIRFTDRDLADYLEAESVRPLRMVTTGRRRSA